MAYIKRKLVIQWLNEQLAKKEKENHAQKNIEPLNTPKVFPGTNSSSMVTKEEPIIWKLAPEPLGFTSFDQDLEEEIVTTNLKERVPRAHHEYLDIFSKQKSQCLPEHTFWDHAIELKPTFKPQTPKIYALSPEKHNELGKFIKEHLFRGTIRRSTSHSTSPLFFMGKKDRKLHLVQDYHHINKHTVPNVCPLPLIQELLDVIKGAIIFSKLDVWWGYNNICIKEGDEWKVAFVTPLGLYKPTVMFFGLTNSSVTFQAMMNMIFRELIIARKITVYMDDILIFSWSMVEHILVLNQVFQILRDNDLYLKPEKCEFYKEKLNYLGYTISKDHVAMEDSKINAIKNWPIPCMVRNIRSFLGLGNFYRRFIDKFSLITWPLYDLTKKDEKWNWTTKCQQAFEQLKKAFTNQPVLNYPNPMWPYRLVTDALLIAYGATLLQEGADNDWHSVVYLSGSFSPAE